jgi:hydrogenase maturation protein HypF
MKGAICLTKTGQALLSHHLGDLDDRLCFEEFRKAVADYAQLFDHAPARIACDLHPGVPRQHIRQGAGRRTPARR